MKISLIKKEIKHFKTKTGKKTKERNGIKYVRKIHATRRS